MLAHVPVSALGGIERLLPSPPVSTEVTMFPFEHGARSMGDGGDG